MPGNVRLQPEQKYTIHAFHRDFPNDGACLEWLTAYLYPNGIRCKKCQRNTTHHFLKKRKALCCDYCGSHIHPTAGTIFHKSSTPLKVWFHAIYIMSATRCGISAAQLMREVGVTYKTAWRMFSQIRKMLREDIRDLGGEVEADETFFGGRKHGPDYWGGSRKTIIAGVVERKDSGGRVAAYVTEGRSLYDLLNPIRERVLPESMIFTDEFGSYKKLSKHGYKHRRIHHKARVYVRGDVHTNTIEGFWSLVKRGISGVHHSVSKKHLQTYLDLYSFRYNHRKDSRPMFAALVSQIESKVADSNQPRKLDV
jgi:transposase